MFQCFDRRLAFRTGRNVFSCSSPNFTSSNFDVSISKIPRLSSVFLALFRSNSTSTFRIPWISEAWKFRSSELLASTFLEIVRDYCSFFSQWRGKITSSGFFNWPKFLAAIGIVTSVDSRASGTLLQNREHRGVIFLCVYVQVVFL